MLNDILYGNKIVTGEEVEEGLVYLKQRMESIGYESISIGYVVSCLKEKFCFLLA